MNYEKIIQHSFLILLVSVFALSCSEESPVVEPNPIEWDGIYRLPLVVHVLHKGEPVGIESNISDERIHRQIEILNEDFRRKVGTPGFNEHPDGEDAMMEFFLASVDPEGLPTSGITRTDILATENLLEPPFSEFDYYGYYQFWDSKDYINIWVLPYGDGLMDLFLGKAIGPVTDLPGGDLLAPVEDGQVEGILINEPHFGESGANSKYNLGRTLTHEMGHYFCLLHPWGGKDCESNDFCSDTPAVENIVSNCSASKGCKGEEIQFENYMNYTPDVCMSMFTKQQVERMHYILENSPRRMTLVNSPALIVD